MELVRVIFYYFLRGYATALAFKEMAVKGVGSIDIQKLMVEGIYAFARDMVSDWVTVELKKKRLGGIGVEVLVDTYRLKIGTMEEVWVLGCIEKESGRGRAYILEDLKLDTVALYITKSVQRHSILRSPYHHKVGWEFLDKFYDHQRLMDDKHSFRRRFWKQQERP